jgi:hypothetical protein
MLPGLRRIAAILNRDHPGDPEDTDSEVVLGFLECLNTIDPASRHIAGTLWWAARRRGTAARSGSYARAACSDLTDRDEIRGQQLTPPTRPSRTSCSPGQSTTASSAAMMPSW